MELLTPSPDRYYLGLNGQQADTLRKTRFFSAIDQNASLPRIERLPLE